MGYLNYNLEKVASYVMEKQALSVADLVRMGKNAVDKDKALHFAKRLMQRNRALANNDRLRTDKWLKLKHELQPALDLEHGYGVGGSSTKEYYRLLKRIPQGPRRAKEFIEELTSPKFSKANMKILDSDLNSRLIQIPITPEQLSTIAENYILTGRSLV